MVIDKCSVIRVDEPILLDDSLFSGQSFRWSRIAGSEGFYASFIGTVPVVIRHDNNDSLYIYSSDESIGKRALSEALRTYLTLDIDNRSLFGERFIKQYPEVAKMVKEYSGLRLLRQDPFETTITFMCAQGIGMTLIRRQTALLCERFGSPSTIEFRGQKLRLYRFPDAETLADAPVQLLQVCTNNNYRRAVNIRGVAAAAAAGRLDFGELGSGELPLDRLRERLCDFDGIGPKIADCIALFGLGRFDAFPIDTHVRQYLAEWFGIRTASDALTQKNYLRLQEEIRTILKPELAGYAGHLLFHCWRRKVKHLRTA